MDAFALGPLMLSAQTLYLIVSVGLFFIGAELAQFLRKRRAASLAIQSRVQPRRNPPPDFSRWAQNSFWLGLVGGRLGYVVRYFDSYRHDLLSVLYFWQPGYSVTAALLSAAAVSVICFRRHLPTLAASLVWLIFCALFWWVLNLSAPLSASQQRPLPALSLTMLTQDGVTLQKRALQQEPGPLIINLWASWCPPCRREMPALVRFAEENPDIRLWLVNQGESAAMVRRFLETSDQPIPEQLILLDPQQSLMQAVAGVGLPITLAYNNGRLVDSHIGEINHARLREMAQAVLK